MVKLDDESPVQVHIAANELFSECPFLKYKQAVKGHQTYNSVIEWVNRRKVNWREKTMQRV